MKEKHEYDFDLLHDEATNLDIFEDKTHEKIADTLKRIIKKEPKGLTIGLEGGWGSGKSSIVKMLRDRINNDNDIKYFYFDAWAHEGDPLRRIFLESLIDNFGDMDKELSEILSHPHRGWISVCLQQDQVIATCQTVIYSNLIRAPFSKAVIDSVVVDEGFRNRGIGYALMEWTMELLHKERCERVMVSTAFSRTVAHRLYEGMGFDQFGYTYLKVLED